MNKLKKIPRWLLVVIGILLVIRLVLPAIILSNLNKFLKDFSPHLEAHIGELDLHIIRGAYEFENIKVFIKGSEKDPFFFADSVDVSISWRELFRGRLLTDIVGDELQFKYSKEVLKAAKAQMKDMKKEERKEVKEKVFPLKVAKIELKDSKFQYDEIRGLPLTLSDIDATMSNVTPSEDSPISFINLKADAMGSSKLKVSGTANPAKDPIEWSVGGEMMNFNLKTMNEFLRVKAPISFTKGTMDLYTEVKSENGRIEGYLKPFMKDMRMVGNEKDFKNLKHFGIELAAAGVNAILKRNENETLATKIVFSYDNENFDWNASKAIGDTLANKFGEELKPGLENRYQLDSLPGKGDQP